MSTAQGNIPNKAKGKGKGKKGQAASIPSSGPVLDQPPIPADVAKNPEELMKLAFKRAMISGNFLDTKFYAYSRRKPSGVVYAPIAIHANSYILRAKEPQYFEPLLRGGYDGYCITGPLDGPFPDEFPAEIGADGYESDSDLEDDEEKAQSAGTSLTGSSSSSEPVILDPDFSLGDSDVERKHETDETNEGHVDREEDPVVGGTGRVRLIRTFAFPTWRAFIFYITTGEISFSRLKSQSRIPGSSETSKKAKKSGASHPASPKSMYTLSDELGLDKLKELAKKDIESKLSADNILAELFSSFTAKYDAIQELEVDYACNNAKEVVAKGLYEWMDSISPEDLKRNAGVLARLFQKMAVGPSNPATSRPTSCPSCRAGTKGYSSFYSICGNCNNNV
ncbi:uncharacterized protein PHACADRAFT_254389 [Phanerochaete carnosa HHB-10118-sp]|uniref:Uncharacterized protein n=1 Tax=Phanerochaete carnosa (strain HHB-10118-sp) TaxID=650164 RepID=K5WCJ4_PHACS|nr:uncharacterized protein PHACADRAFT_254389 [Phanerochaete carnosa HHB-10118-sp]EKM56965.1 hypothetical protein PHACADRAFT_254389 [Phanerochaete carnosa HHB-10118-sp]